MAILGEMLELGDGSVEYHRRLVDHCGGIDHIVCVGQGMNALWNELPASQRLLQAERAAEVPLQEIVAALAPGDVVLVKGSNRVFWADKFVKRLQKRVAIAVRANGRSKAPSAPRSRPFITRQCSTANNVTATPRIS